MSDLLERSLHGVAIYNPRLLSKEELIGFFVARQVELERLVEALRREAKAQPQHHLVVGARGMGKTTLLHRVRYAIEDDEELASRCLGLVFPEEQYNVVCLADFWLNCVDALADGLEAAGRTELLEGLDEEIERVQALPRKDDRGRRALELLCQLSDRLQRRLVLLVDNVDLVLDRLEDEQWALREVLSSEPRIQLIGATSAPLESQYRHDKAFYDFFRVHHLDGLDDEATFTVLRRLAEVTGHDRVARLLDEEPGRVRTVRLMAGGNPRTVVLLFSVLAQGTDGDVRTDIERILDQCTPLYKHRLEVLSTQAQQVLDALAKHWAPATANEIADATHLQVNVISAQLDRLVKDGTVEKVSLPDTKRQGFQIAERFFNIWCLMRASRRVRRRLVWLVEFLRLMFGAEELKKRAKRHISIGRPSDALRYAEMGLALADTVEDTRLRTALETQSIRSLCVSPALRQRLPEFFDLEGQDSYLTDRTERLRMLEEARTTVRDATLESKDWSPEAAWITLGGTPQLAVLDKLEMALSFKSRSHAWLRSVLEFTYGIYRGAFLPNDFEILTRALRDGLLALENPTPEELSSAAFVLKAPSLVACTLGMASHMGAAIDFPRLDSEIRKSKSILPWLVWAEQALLHGTSVDKVSRSISRIMEGHDWDDMGLVLTARFLHQHAGQFPAIESTYEHLMNTETHAFMVKNAWFSVFGNDWPDALEWFVLAFTGRHIRFLGENWDQVLIFFFLAVHRGFVAEARELVEKIGASERWETLDHALAIVAHGDSTALGGLAPEMREAVRLVLARISPRTLEEPTSPPKRRRPQPTKRS